uniref:Uncharacterized protein n=1 Tax=Oryza punctata TaxID=4537 RepID=A0A0E0L5N7_ORYPU
MGRRRRTCTLYPTTGGGAPAPSIHGDFRPRSTHCCGRAVGRLRSHRARNRWRAAITDAAHPRHHHHHHQRPNALRSLSPPRRAARAAVQCAPTRRDGAQHTPTPTPNSSHISARRGGSAVKLFLPAPPLCSALLPPLPSLRSGAGGGREGPDPPGVGPTGSGRAGREVRI